MRKSTSSTNKIYHWERVVPHPVGPYKEQVSASFFFLLYCKDMRPLSVLFVALSCAGIANTAYIQTPQSLANILLPGTPGSDYPSVPILLNDPSLFAKEPDPKGPGDVNSDDLDELSNKVRMLVHTNTLTTLSTINQETCPAGDGCRKLSRDFDPILDFPYEGVEYYADCTVGNDDGLTMLRLNTSLGWENVENGSPFSLTIRVGDRNFFGFTPRSPYKHHRVSLWGTLSEQLGNDKHLRRCFGTVHRDARGWLSNNGSDSAQGAIWYRFELTHIYFEEGLGPDTYSGPIPIAYYHNATIMDAKVSDGFTDGEIAIRDFRAHWLSKINDFSTDAQYFAAVDEDARRLEKERSSREFDLQEPKSASLLAKHKSHKLSKIMTVIARIVGYYDN